MPNVPVFIWYALGVGLAVLVYIYLAHMPRASKTLSAEVPSYQAQQDRQTQVGNILQILQTQHNIVDAVHN